MRYRSNLTGVVHPTDHIMTSIYTPYMNSYDSGSSSVVEWSNDDDEGMDIYLTVLVFYEVCTISGRGGSVHRPLHHRPPTTPQP